MVIIGIIAWLPELLPEVVVWLPVSQLPSKQDSWAGHCGYWVVILDGLLLTVVQESVFIHGLIAVDLFVSQV